MIETTGIVEPWLYETLSTDPAIIAAVGDLDSISGTLSPVVLTPPYVTFICQSSRDVTGNAGQRISTDNLYAVKAVAQTATWNDVEPIAERIDTLLQRPQTVITRARGSLTCVRESIISYPEVNDGVQYRHLGAIWRIRASADT